MSRSPNLSLPYIQPAQAQKHLTHNLAIERLDALVQLSVTELHATELPQAPFDGQVIGIGAGATGEIEGQDGKLAYFTNGAWMYVEPRNGFKAWVEAKGSFYVYQDGDWRVLLVAGEVGTTAPDRVDGLGINAGWNTTNRLSVAAPATLLNHDGAGHRLKVNKAGADDTASLLFQSAFSGRAEMGLAGDDDFALKVSADGEAWITAITIDAGTGASDMGAVRAASYGGAGVQSAPDDVTPGRLMRADWGYGPGNLVGPVAQSMGIPTGAAIERGTTPTGSYVRLADGTQICSAATFVTQANVAAEWVFPVPFATEEDLFVGMTSTYAGGPRIFATDTTTRTGVTIRSWSETGSQAVAPPCCVIAVGRWF